MVSKRIGNEQLYLAWIVLRRIRMENKVVYRNKYKIKKNNIILKIFIYLFSIPSDKIIVTIA